MIIDAKTVILTFAIIGVATYFGLGAIRSFALSIAEENHDANLAADMTDEAKRAKRVREADEAATQAFAKVEPLLPASVVGQATTASATISPPASGNSLNLNVGRAANNENNEVLEIMKIVFKVKWLWLCYYPTSCIFSS